MLLIDQNEHRNHPDLTLLLEQSLEVQIGDYNQSPNGGVTYPDFTVSGGETLVGINRKTCGEWLSDSDKVIEQVQRELAGPCEQLVLLIEGVMKTGVEGGVEAYQFQWKAEHFYNKGQDHGSVPFARRYYAVNYKHAQNQQTRLEWLGVMVTHTYDIRDTASKLIAMHDLVLKGEPNKVLDRLIKQEFHIQALDPIERAMALSLMGIINGGVGETTALTISASFSTIGELMNYWSTGGTIADMVMQSGRRVGVAAEKKLQKALGWNDSCISSTAGRTNDTGDILEPSSLV